MQQSTESPQEEQNEYQSGYKAGRLVGTVKAALAALGWDEWGEPNSPWQCGFLAGYESWGKTQE